jgi:PiT family inorganic phosphate transporter
VAVFVGFDIGGSSTGVAFGPAVGSRVTSNVVAGLLMAGFALLGGWTVGRNVVETMGGRTVPSNQFTLAASVGVLFFVGLTLLVSNRFGVPAVTSMTAVGAVSMNAGIPLAGGATGVGAVTIARRTLDTVGNDLFDPVTTGRVIMLWVLTPSISALLSFLLFEFAPV